MHGGLRCVPGAPVQQATGVCFPTRKDVALAAVVGLHGSGQAWAADFLHRPRVPQTFAQASRQAVDTAALNRRPPSRTRTGWPCQSERLPILFHQRMMMYRPDRILGIRRHAVMHGMASSGEIREAVQQPSGIHPFRRTMAHPHGVGSDFARAPIRLPGGRVLAQAAQDQRRSISPPMRFAS